MKRPILPVRSAHRPVSVTRRTSGDTAAILLRAGDKDLGAITQLGSDTNDTLSGNFVNRPAFADVADAFHAHAQATESGAAAAIAATLAALAPHAIQVWHSIHDMRIDEPGSLVLASGRVHFKPNAAFLMMRTGGL